MPWILPYPFHPESGLLSILRLADTTSLLLHQNRDLTQRGRSLRRLWESALVVLGPTRTSQALTDRLHAEESSTTHLLRQTFYAITNTCHGYISCADGCIHSAWLMGSNLAESQCGSHSTVIEPDLNSCSRATQSPRRTADVAAFVLAAWTTP
jgi:hypothetical protein